MESSPVDILFFYRWTIMSYYFQCPRFQIVCTQSVLTKLFPSLLHFTFSLFKRANWDVFHSFSYSFKFINAVASFLSVNEHLKKAKVTQESLEIYEWTFKAALTLATFHSKAQSNCQGKGIHCAVGQVVWQMLLICCPADIEQRILLAWEP